MVVLKVGKCPTDGLSLTNKVIVNSGDQQGVLRGSQHVVVQTGGGAFLFSLEANDGVPPGFLGFSLPQRKWAVLSLNQVH